MTTTQEKRKTDQTSLERTDTEQLVKKRRRVEDTDTGSGNDSSEADYKYGACWSSLPPTSPHKEATQRTLEVAVNTVNNCLPVSECQSPKRPSLSKLPATCWSYPSPSSSSSPSSCSHSQSSNSNLSFTLMDLSKALDQFCGSPKNHHTPKPSINAHLAVFHSAAHFPRYRTRIHRALPPVPIFNSPACSSQ